MASEGVAMEGVTLIWVKEIGEKWRIDGDGMMMDDAGSCDSDGWLIE